MSGEIFIYIVHPDDPGLDVESFTTKESAQQYADGLPCGYWIEEVTA